MATYQVLGIHLGSLSEKIAAMNKRAVKLGCEPITYKVGERKLWQCKHPITGIQYQQSFYEVEVQGQAPRLNGFVFAAKIEPTPNGNLVKCLPGESAPEWAWQTPMDCQHCNTNRYRKEVFLVRNVSTGKYVLVGRNCLADYLGGQSPEVLARRAEFDIEVNETFSDGDWFGSYNPTEDTVQFVALSNAIARCIGFVTRKMIDDGKVPYFTDTTANIAWMLSTNSVRHDEFCKEHDTFKVLQGDVYFANEAIAWAKTLTEDNDYVRNLRVALASDTTDIRSKGIVASVIPAYLRSMQVKQEKEARPESHHLGAIGDKLSTKVTVNFVRYLNSDYGVTTLINMSDDNGNIIVWFASGEHDVEKGEVYNIKGTVKKLDEFGGVKQTILTRCKMDRVN